MEKRIDRDELERLLETPAVTIYSWWNRGYVPPPSSPGNYGQRGSFTLDEAFALYVLAIITRQEKRKLREGAVAYRYLQHRPSTLEILAKCWERPVTFTIYPAYDLAGLNVPKRELEERKKSAYEQMWTLLGLLKEQEKPRKLEMTALGNFWYKINELDKFTSKHEVIDVERALRASGIFIDYKDYFHEKREVSSNTILGGTQGMPRKVPLLERLIAEAWAMHHIDEVIEINPLRNIHDTKRRSHFTVDVTRAVDEVWKIA